MVSVGEKGRKLLKELESVHVEAVGIYRDFFSKAKLLCAGDLIRRSKI